MLDALNDGRNGCVERGAATYNPVGDAFHEAAGGVAQKDRERCGAENKRQQKGKEASRGTPACGVLRGHDWLDVTSRLAIR
jgi:hypothetical protein